MRNSEREKAHRNGYDEKIHTHDAKEERRKKKMISYAQTVHAYYIKPS